MIRTLFTSVAILSLVAGAPIAQAQSLGVDAVVAQSRSVTVAKDKSLAFRLNAEVGELVVAQPGIAEIVAKTDRSFYIRGKAFGTTNILVYGPNQNLIEVIDVRVAPDAESLRQDLAASMPGETIQVSNLADGLLLSGRVSTTATMNRAINVARRYAGEQVSTNMQVTSPDQVVLEVRILEASRTAMRDLGINLSILGSDGSLITGAGLLGVTPPAATGTISGISNGTTLSATIRALEDQGLVRTLAQPNLVAMSGEEASFLAGGEFPFPVPAGRDQVTIEFKPFGVTLKFTPEVRENGRIRLKVAPEVSQLDTTTSVRVDGVDVPGLSVRRAATTVEMDSGRSFAIAGLFQRDQINSTRQVPGLGDVPILGSLFRSKRWRDAETELVIIVTPRMADMDAPIHNPLDANFDEPRRVTPPIQTVLAPPAAQPVAMITAPAPAPITPPAQPVARTTAPVMAVPVAAPVATASAPPPIAPELQPVAALQSTPAAAPQADPAAPVIAPAPAAPLAPAQVAVQAPAPAPATPVATQAVFQTASQLTATTISRRRPMIAIDEDDGYVPPVRAPYVETRLMAVPPPVIVQGDPNLIDDLLNRVASGQAPEQDGV